MPYHQQHKKKTTVDRRLMFSPYAWAKMAYLRDKGKSEVGGFAVTPLDDPLYVEDVILPDQENTVAFCDLNDDSVAELMDDLVDAGLQPKQFMRIWWHTHPGSSAAPSGQDERTFEDTFGNCDWAIMFILAKGGATTCRLKFYHQGLGIHVSQEIEAAVDWNAEFSGSQHDLWDEIYNESVTIKAPSKPKYGHGGRYTQHNYGNIRGFSPSKEEPQDPDDDFIVLGSAYDDDDCIVLDWEDKDTALEEWLRNAEQRTKETEDELQMLLAKDKQEASGYVLI